MPLVNVDAYVYLNLAGEATGLSCWWFDLDGIRHAHHENWDQPISTDEADRLVDLVRKSVNYDGEPSRRLP